MSKKLPPLAPSGRPNNSSSSASASTYELLQAQTHATSQSDPISWSASKSYRQCPYRQLHHQGGVIGTYTVRLLECQNLQRSHWSLLGMGPVRHLGLSRAHGEVSSYVELSLGWSSADDAASNTADTADAAAAAAAATAAAAAASDGTAQPSPMVLSEVNSKESTEEEEEEEDELDRKPAALPLDRLDRPQHQQQQQHRPDFMTMSLRDAASRQQMLDFGNGAKKKFAADDDDDDAHVESMHDIGSNPYKNASSNASQEIHHGGGGGGGGSTVHRSSTVHRNSNPIWPTSQRNGNRSLFAIRLHKRKHSSNKNNADDEDGSSQGSGNTDGQRIHLQIVVREEMTGVENALPDPFGLGLTKGGGAGSQGGTIGFARVDVTDLALGGLLENDGKENYRDGNAGGGSAGGEVIDAWADLNLPTDNSHTGVARSASAAHAAEQAKAKQRCTGRVRVLVSYEPHGMEPRRGDVAALECFARRNPSTSSCRILIPPLSPLRVLDVVGSYCLVEYDLPSSNLEALTTRDRKKQFAQHGHNDQQDDRNRNNGSRKTGRARIHRNSIFVIERTNAVDGAVNLALAPVDAYLSTPLGRATSQIAGPLFDAAGELVAPAMLTGRLMLASSKTVGAIGLNSAGAIVSTVAKSLDSNNEQVLDDRDPLSKV